MTDGVNSAHFPKSAIFDGAVNVGFQHVMAFDPKHAESACEQDGQKAPTPTLLMAAISKM
eukprot:1785777-Rhodomonas_salina.1